MPLPRLWGAVGCGLAAVILSLALAVQPVDYNGWAHTGASRWGEIGPTVPSSVAPQGSAPASPPPGTAAAQPQKGSQTGPPFVVTFVDSDDGYVSGAAVLGASVRKAGRFDGPMVLMTPPGTLGTDSLALLRRVGWTIQKVEQIPSPWRADQCGKFCNTYTKLRAWQLAAHGPVGLFLDADTMVVGPLEGLLEQGKGINDDMIAAADDQGDTQFLNSGMVLFRPSERVFQRMRQQMGKIEHLARAVDDKPWNMWEYGDQNFIHAFFQPCPNTAEDQHCHDRRVTLPPETNCQMHAYPQLASHCTVVHFTANTKAFNMDNRLDTSNVFRSSVFSMWVMWDTYARELEILPPSPKVFVSTLITSDDVQVDSVVVLGSTVRMPGLFTGPMVAVVSLAQCKSPPCFDVPCVGALSETVCNGRHLCAWQDDQTCAHDEALASVLSPARLGAASEQKLQHAGWQVKYADRVTLEWPDEDCGSFCDLHSKLLAWTLEEAGTHGLFIDSSAMVQQSLERLVVNMGWLVPDIHTIAIAEGMCTSTAVFAFMPSKTMMTASSFAKMKISTLGAEYTSIMDDAGALAGCSSSPTIDADTARIVVFLGNVKPWMHLHDDVMLTWNDDDDGIGVAHTQNEKAWRRWQVVALTAGLSTYTSIVSTAEGTIDPAAVVAQMDKAATAPHLTATGAPEPCIAAHAQVMCEERVHCAWAMGVCVAR